MATAAASSNSDNTPAPLASPQPSARPAHQVHHPRLSNARRSISQLSQMNPAPSGEGPTPAAIPTPKQPHGQQAAGQQLDAPRSPPGTKNLAHVPCKFFRQGACQAGKACPFSHSIDPASDSAPCKYFSKGNCKFGQKCALAHILPDGRRVNRPHHGNVHGGHLQFGRIDTAFTNHRSALHNSLMQANLNNGQHTPNQSIGGPEDFPPLGAQPIPPQPEQVMPPPPQPALTEAAFAAAASPRNVDGFGMSPLASSHRTLGPLDATLPASIDRYDYSYFAKHGPFASSVPNTFGVDSPPPSLPNSIRGESTVSALRRSVFGDDDVVGSPSGELSRSARLGEGSFSERILHSSMNRRSKVYSSSYAGPQMMSHLGARGINGLRDTRNDGDFDDDHFAFEEDFVPESLSDLLTPAERNRRMSRTDDGDGVAFRSSLSASLTANNDVFGSPPVGSPSSWGPLINRHKRDDDHKDISGLGHVGSPLRHSYLRADSTPATRAISRNSADGSMLGTSPARSGGGISALTQSLKLSSLNDDFVGHRHIERAISSPGIPTKTVEPIDEEPETQFNLEVEEDGPTKVTGGFGSNDENRPGLGGIDDKFFTGRS